MTAALIVLAVLLAVVLLALGLFLFACRRSPAPDFTKPAVIAKWGRAEQTEEILAGIALMRDAEDIFLPSHDGLRLHGQLLQQPGAKGTILLFHGYRSSWIIDFSIVLPYYYSLGYNLLAVDERAHGQSEGVSITFGIHERRDAVTWAQYAAMHFGPEHPLFLGGLSMGRDDGPAGLRAGASAVRAGRDRRLRVFLAGGDHEKRFARARKMAPGGAAAGADGCLHTRLCGLFHQRSVHAGRGIENKASHSVHPRHSRYLCPLRHVAGRL